MVSSWMPDVEVHIAFDSGYNTPAASRTWTDVSSYVELADRIRIAFGRRDERSTADANQLTLTLDNTDGRFTAGRSASPYYPNVKIGRPIRVRVTPPSGTVSTRFIGFIDEWPVEWDGADAYAMAKIRATSRLARLGLSAKLRSVVEQAALASDPDRYWTLGDPSGSSTASESSGNGGERLTMSGSGTAVAFGNATGVGTDGLTAGEFAGGQWLSGVGSGASTTACGASAFILRSSAPASREVFLSTMPSNTAADGFVASLTTSGVVAVSLNYDVDETVITGAVNVCDGATHHVAVVRSGTALTLYVDGASDGSAVVSASAYPRMTPQVGGATHDDMIAMTGTAAHAAFWFSSAPTSTQIATISDAGSTGFAGERTDERLERILGWAGVASTEVTTETGVETMTYQQTSGQSVVDALRDVESTEGGVLFDGRDGNVTFHNRSHRYQKTASATLDMASQHVGADYTPKLDRSALVNDVEVSNPTTDEKARAVDTDSQDEYGIATTSATSVADSYEPLQQKAAWMIASYAEPRMRVPSLTVDVLAHQGLTPSAQTLLGITVGDLLAVSNAPTQSDTTSPSYFVEGYTETIGPESYEISFNLSPVFPAGNVLILDHASRAGLDEGNILGL